MVVVTWSASTGLEKFFNDPDPPASLPLAGKPQLTNLKLAGGRIRSGGPSRGAQCKTLNTTLGKTSTCSNCRRVPG